MQPQAFCRCSIWSLLLFWLLAFPLPASGQEASANRVSLEVVTHPNLTPGVAQDWMRKLESLKLDSLRVRSGTGREKPELRQESGTSKPTFRVIAILTRGNQLLLPDATFRSNELPKLRSYLQKLGTKQDDPPAGSLAPLGLTGEQWDAVREKLRPPVTDSTKGQRVAKVVEQLQQQLGEPLQWELGSETAIDEPFDVPDELQGLSLGTALAAALRPAGLVLVPRPTEGTSLVRLAVARSEDGKQVWPVGWAPDERPGKLVPKLFDFFPAEIENAGLV
ncbi:MAG: hypothetical protein KDA99_22150, partial [Planctomycetales bacterium]|nr:hypothetical protein [Planctomycetales bacterium]